MQSMRGDNEHWVSIRVGTQYKGSSIIVIVIITSALAFRNSSTPGTSARVVSLILSLGTTLSLRIEAVASVKSSTLATAMLCSPLTSFVPMRCRRSTPSPTALSRAQGMGSRSTHRPGGEWA